MLSGINHIALLTGDTDRLRAFYGEVFEATNTTLQQADGFRVTAIWLGDTAELNVFQIADNGEHERLMPMFGRGRLDHLAPQEASVSSFDDISSLPLARGGLAGSRSDERRVGIVGVGTVKFRRWSVQQKKQN